MEAPLGKFQIVVNLLAISLNGRLHWRRSSFEMVPRESEQNAAGHTADCSVVLQRSPSEMAYFLTGSSADLISPTSTNAVGYLPV